MPLTALLSVSDKTGIVEFAQALEGLGVRLLSTGGTAKLLAEAGLRVTEVAEITGFPEMLDGRVKTLHPRVHAGLLARRELPEHMAALAEHGIDTIDILVVNLYPFAQATAQADCTLANAIENIDIGGPTMLRAAAKNWQDVAVVVDPRDYTRVVQTLQQGPLTRSEKFDLAKKVFAHTAAYDGMITNYLSALLPDAAQAPEAVPQRLAFPNEVHLQFEKAQDMRYGENPHQQAAFYRDVQAPVGSLALWQQIQGKELSYNNIADADAAWECVKSFIDEGTGQRIPACVIIKHANPCGVATGASVAQAYAKALKTDPTSAFGGIIAFNQALDGEAARAVAQQFVEVVIAPSFSDEARAVFATKVNVRLLQVALPATDSALDSAVVNSVEWGRDIKRVGGGVLIQSVDAKHVRRDELRVVSKRQPSPQQWEDLMFAWKVAKYVKSNAIVFCAQGMTLGVGAGQMSRIDSARIASIKAANAALSLTGSAVASDAFFPFRDGLDVVVDAGASSVIHPGGSMRDEEVIAAANERDIAMVFTGTRHFRH